MTAPFIDPQRIERRARKRMYVRGRAPLSWALSACEALSVALFLVLVVGTGGVSGAVAGLTWGVFTYPSWYLFVGGHTRFAPMLASAGGFWTLAMGVAWAFDLTLKTAIDFGPYLASGAIGLLACLALRTLIIMGLVQTIVRGQLQFEQLALVGRTADIEAFLIREQTWKRGLQPKVFHGVEHHTPAALEAFVARCVIEGCTQIQFVTDQTDVDQARLQDICSRYNIDAFFAPSSFDTTEREWIAERPVGFTGSIAKRSFDLVAASVLIVCLSPLLLAVALAIVLETPGPALFRQERMGFNGRSFLIYKFRSMRVMEPGTAIKQARKGDARITRLGRIIRATSIDELPQLLNVLRGDMSLVGPRPHAISHDWEMDRAVAHYAHRNRLKPGITGWAQVNGYRGDTSTREKIEGRVAHDLYYIENWSIAFDIRILLLTAFSSKARQNAF